MKEKRIPRDFDSLSQIDTVWLKELHKILKNREIFNALHDRLIEIIGPMSVKERWELLGAIGLQGMRSQISLEGPAFVVGSAILSFAFGEYSYPYNIAILQAISVMAVLGEHAGVLTPFLME